MKAIIGVLFCGLALTGCGPARVARTAAVTSYHVATAPVKVARWALKDRSEPPTQTTTNTDVDVPGHPVATPSPTPKQRNVATTSARAKSKTATASTTPPQTQFPVAKPVPGKPGYVYSPYDSGKYVDVSGYTSGSKVKDPYAQKIFIVP